MLRCSILQVFLTFARRQTDGLSEGEDEYPTADIPGKDKHRAENPEWIQNSPPAYTAMPDTIPGQTKSSKRQSGVMSPVDC